MSEYEPITAELRAALDVDREFMRADGTVVAQTFCVDRGDFDRCCDAIDAVHAQLERENAELRERLAVLDNERGNMHDGWVKLPVDADGVPIHIGDKVYHKSFPRGKHRVVCGIGENSFYYQSGAGFNWFFHADEVSHHHAPTVEDVLTEFGIDWEHEDNCEDRAALLKEYAKRLTLAGDAS